MPPAPIEKNLLLLTTQAKPFPTSNGYANLYSYDSENEPVFEKMVSGKTLEPINKYSVAPLSKTLVSTPHKVLKKNARRVDGNISQL